MKVFVVAETRNKIGGGNDGSRRHFLGRCFRFVGDEFAQERNQDEERDAEGEGDFGYQK